MINSGHEFSLFLNVLSKPNVTQLNSTQSNSKATSLGKTRVPPYHHPTTINFSITSRPVRELNLAQTLTQLG